MRVISLHRYLNTTRFSGEGQYKQGSSNGHFLVLHGMYAFKYLGSHIKNGIFLVTGTAHIQFLCYFLHDMY
jgi:hypothetical protein